MEWLILLIPLLGVFIAYKWFRPQLTVWEGLVPFAITIGILLGVKAISTSVRTSDDEYWGSMIIEARYYEYWSTWVTETCSSTSCTSNSDGTEDCTTTYYDCSYCQEHSAYWEAYDDMGNSFRISQKYYLYLKKKWNSKETFVDMHRSIDKHWRCGKDGNAYSIKWDGNIPSSEAAVIKYKYKNKVQSSHSAFKLPYVSKQDAIKEKLFEYPKLNGYKQRCVLGIDSIYSQKEVETIETWYQYLNGHYGKLNKVRIFLIVFYDKEDKQISFDQEAYWDGGNQNEIVVTMSLNRKTKEIQWVRPFSWTDNKRVLVDIRDDIYEEKIFNPRATYNAIEKAIGKYDIHKSFKHDFNYLSIDIPNGAIMLAAFLSFMTVAIFLKWAVENEFVQE